MKTLFFTFDVDWANDDVLSYCLDLCEEAQIEATFFATHDTPLLKRIRNNAAFELGIHPNFNPLLDKTSDVDSAKSVLSKIKQIIPEARAVRSHSLAQSSRLLSLFGELGFTHDANMFIPYTAGIPLRAWRDWQGVIRVPHCWEDDVQASTQGPWDAAPLLGVEGLKVLDFHPIHLFLNTEDLKRYESARPVLKDTEALIKHRNGGNGTKTFFEQLVALVKQRGLKTGKISAIHVSPND